MARRLPTKEDLASFEKEIADLFAAGKIRAPVHLRGGREEHLIRIFQEQCINDDDYVIGYWDSHELALLKGVPHDELRKAILEGKNISLCFPKYKIFCSGIVGSLMGVGTGVAWALKKKKDKGRVFVFCGDMSSETGIFFESVKYAYNFDLPITFVVCDNGLSVMTPTREAWGSPEPWFKGTKFEKKIIHFQYKNTYPHSGLGRLIKF